MAAEGPVSGLVFGTARWCNYFTVDLLAEFHLTMPSAIPSIRQLILTGHSAPDSVFATLIGPVRYFVLDFVLDFVWRFLTDPITRPSVRPPPWSALPGPGGNTEAQPQHCDP
jgi:hypothetical protein